MSPERLRGENYDSTGDVWSVGVTMLELWLKRYPFRNTETPISLLGEIERTDFRRLFKGLRMSDHMQQCLLEMLDLNPYRRLHSADLINMSWFEYCNSSTLTTAQQVRSFNHNACMVLVHMHRAFHHSLDDVLLCRSSNPGYTQRTTTTTGSPTATAPSNPRYRRWLQQQQLLLLLTRSRS